MRERERERVYVRNRVEEENRLIGNYYFNGNILKGF